MTTQHFDQKKKSPDQNNNKEQKLSSASVPERLSPFLFFFFRFSSTFFLPRLSSTIRTIDRISSCISSSLFSRETSSKVTNDICLFLLLLSRNASSMVSSKWWAWPRFLWCRSWCFLLSNVEDWFSNSFLSWSHATRLTVSAALHIGAMRKRM